MGRKKYDKDFKLQLVKEHNENGVSYWKLSKIYGVEASINRRWGHIYDAFGEDGLEKHNRSLKSFLNSGIPKSSLIFTSSIKKILHKFYFKHLNFPDDITGNVASATSRFKAVGGIYNTVEDFAIVLF